jgi:uncharacterized protein YggE
MSVKEADIAPSREYNIEFSKLLQLENRLSNYAQRFNKCSPEKSMSAQLNNRLSRVFALYSRRLALVAFMACFPAIASAQAQLSGTQEEIREIVFPRPDQVSIEGKATLTTFKDSAQVELIVTTESRSLETAMRDNQALRSRLAQRFIDAGINANSINNAKFSSSPKKGFLSQKTNSFEVGAKLQVTVASEAELQLLAAAADQYEEVELVSTEFEHSKVKELEKQVRELAVKDALDQAAFYSQTLGFALKPVNFYPQTLTRNSRPQLLMSRAMAMDEIAAPASMDNFDEIEFDASVTVVFEIVQNEK